MERRSNLRDLSTPIEWLDLEVFRDHHGVRLDSFLGEHLPWRSKTVLQSWIDDGQVRVKGRESVKKSLRLRVGDVIRIAVPAPTDEVRHEELARGLVFLYEDDDLLAIDKAPGLVVHPVGKVRINTLIQALHWYYRHGPGRRDDRRIVPKICHRLDKDTSGVMIVAKNDEARRRLQESFEARTVRKSYETLLRGQVEFSERQVSAPIGPDPSGEHGMKMAVRSDGAAARSTFHRLAHARLPDGSWYSHCRVSIESGRQHQIRVHAAHLGHPVLCDTLYGAPEQRSIDDANGVPMLARQALHAARLSLPHPLSAQALDMVAALPSDMVRLLEARGGPSSNKEIEP